MITEGHGAASDMFAAPQADLPEVLLSEVVAVYLQSLQPTQAPVRSARRGSSDNDGALDGVPSKVQHVLQFAALHAKALFALLQGSSRLVDGSVVTHADSESNTVTKLTNGKAAPSKCVTAPLAATAAAAAAEAEAEGQDRRSLANVTELLSFCILHSVKQDEINAVVAACVRALSGRSALEAQRTFAVQRLLLEAFDSDFESTTQAIADTLTPSTITGVVENLASNSIVAETLIALFGSALSAVWMVKPTTKTALFTSQWIQLKFPATLCAYLPIAIRDPSMFHYFYFFKELLKRGYSHSAGPIVDVLLGEPLVSEYVERILRCCEQDVGRSPLYSPEGAAAPPVSLTADGMEVLAAIVSLVRKSLVLPETGAMYAAATHHIRPLAVLQAEAPRMVALLAPTAKEAAALTSAVVSPRVSLSRRSSSGASPRRGSASLSGLEGGGFGLGPLRLAVCELFVELSLLQLASTDATLISCGFFPAFLRCCERFPQHDALARAMHRCRLAIFQRAPLVGESLGAAAERDHLWKYLVRPGTATLHAGAATSVLGAITQLAQVPDTSLSSHCIDVLTSLAALPLFRSAAGGPLERHLDAYRNCAAIQERVRHMATPVTGEQFDDRGSAGLQDPVHRDTINLAGDRFRGPRTGLYPRGSRGSGSAGKSSTKGAYIIVRHSADDDRPQRSAQEAVVDIEDLKREVQALQQASSPAVQSYPSFSQVSLGFFASTAVTDAADSVADSSPPGGATPTGGM